MTSLPWQSERRILICVSGGIAAYKIPYLVRGFIKAGCQVRVAMSRAAEKFVTPLVLATLSHQRVWTEDDFLSDEHGWEIPHISLADWAEVILMAPCTANRIAQLVSGSAGTLVDALALAARVPILLFPAMNVHMLSNPSTLANLKVLKSRGFSIIDPDSGDLACGYQGSGRLPETDEIMEETWKAICPKRDLTGKTVLVTAGPTREFLDPVRFISNPSSGKMGYALARVSAYRGANVILVSGPTPLDVPHGVQRIPVVTALDMMEVVKGNLNKSDLIIACAAVSDYRSEVVEDHKIKREKLERVTRTFVQNPDIAAWVGAHKRGDQILVGFAAETDDIKQNALGKLQRKNLDFIAANDLKASGSGFGTETNDVKLFDRNGSEIEIQGTKDQVANGILDRVMGFWC